MKNNSKLSNKKQAVKLPILIISIVTILMALSGIVTALPDYGTDTYPGNYTPDNQQVLLINNNSDVIAGLWEGNNTGVYYYNTSSTSWEKESGASDKTKAIQRAIDKSTIDNQTIIVGDGTYNGTLNINNDNVKEVIGYENKPTIDAEVGGTPITIDVDDVIVKELNITKSGGKEAGIKINSDNVTITNNTITKNGQVGVYLYSSSNNTISSNEITNNKYYGIYLYSSSVNSIYLNNFLNHYQAHVYTGRYSSWGSSNLMNYTYDGEEYTNKLGNYYDDFTDSDADDDGVWDNTKGNDKYPLVDKAGHYSNLTPIEEIVEVDGVIGTKYEENPPGNQEVYLVNTTGHITGAWEGNIDTAEVIQRANDEATSDNHIIIVGNGTYKGNLDINNPDVRKVIGYENKPTIDAENSGSPITINANDITVKELNITGSGSRDNAGIKINLDNATITNNTINNNRNGIYLYSSNNTVTTNEITTNNKYGVYLSSSNNNTVTSNNIINNNLEYGEAGIYLTQSSDNTFISNNVTDNYRGIYLEQGNNNVFTDNNITDNIGDYVYRSKNFHGVHLVGSSDNSFTGNNIKNITGYSETPNGVYFGESSDNNTFAGNEITNCATNGILLSGIDNTITNNKITNNKNGIHISGTGSEANNNSITNNEITNNTKKGISFYLADDNTVANNNITTNENGIEIVESSSYNTVANNNITSNDNGIYLYGSSDNSIYLNNFIDNGNHIYFDVDVNPDYDSDNSWVSPELTYIYNEGTNTSRLGNYWDDYKGNDEDGDGIGETTYTIQEDAGNDTRPLVNTTNQYSIPKTYSVSLGTVSESESVGVNENASYTLTVKNTGNLDDSYNLVISSPRADAFLDKSSLNLAPGESKSVNLNVSSDSGGNFDVDVSAISTNTGQKEIVTTTTKVEQYGLTMSADSTSSTIKPGNETNYSLTVKNTGNREDTYNLEVTAPSLSPGLTTGSLTIAPGNTQLFNVTLSNSTTGSYTATVNASSTNDTDEWTEKTLELNVEKGDNPDVSLSLNPTTKRVERNGEAAYTIKVKNTGNVEDTYSLINGSDASSSLGTSNMNLGPGESSSTILTVSNTSEIKTYATDITVESDNFDVSSSGTVYTKAVKSVDIIASPGSQTTTPGNNSTYTISILNTGIQTHNYTVSIPSKTSNTDSTLSKSTINVLETGQTAEIKLSLNNTKSLAGGESRGIEAAITASVTESPDKSDTTTVSSLYTEEEVYGVSISSDVVEQAVKPGNNATYLLTIQNLGNSDETINLSKSVQKGNLEKSSVYLSSSGDLGGEKVVKFNQPSSEAGEVVITANSSGITDSLILNTRVAEIDQEYVVNSDVDDASTVTNSEVESSTIVNSEVINDSVVNSSRVIDSSINNTKVIDSDLSNVMIKNGVVENNLIKKGVVTVDGTEYELTEEDEAVTAEELVSSQEFDSNIVGFSGEITQITSQNSNVTLNMTSDENYVGGSMKLQRSSTPPTDVDAENTKTSQYVRIKPTVNVEESTKYYVIKLSYTDEWLKQENIIEDTVSIYRYDENTGEWVKLVEEGDPSFCNGVERNLENNYVKANVTKFSTYEINGQRMNDREDGDRVEEVSGTDDDSVRVSVGESMPAESVRSTNSKQKVVSAGESVEYNFSESSGPVKGISFESKENMGRVIAKVQTLDKLPDDVKSPTETGDSDSTESGEKDQTASKTYSTMSITVGKSGTVSESNSDNTLIEFDVTKEWVEDNNIDPETIRMERYHNGEWHDLPTNKVAEDDNLLHFTAFTPGFSIFAVVGDEIDTGIEEQETENDPEVDETVEPEPETESTPGFTSLLILGVIGTAYMVLRRKN
ncbi:NosD domain-containing protein [Methanohalophilus mahii]|uniref:Periplasmic copper-binding protein n=1 Tax=Methanohalophilus mahii (strain ATCC 35705 / DSM 5219 / SLP) TaxID=547558 RepID=D5E8R5_METMS|nr:NosD domain-containing protein [Methanohalophilus mahii]ADE35574.1 periplasmic copper-binding protein [Methanohalophilus mahii DSM 5219]